MRFAFFNDILRIMSSAFLRSIKWVCVVLCIIGGIYGFHLAETQGHVRPMMISVVCLGIVYLMNKFWSQLSKIVLLFSSVFVLVLAFIAQDQYGPILFYDLTGTVPPQDYFANWALCVLFIGLPVMTIVMFFYGDDDS